VHIFSVLLKFIVVKSKVVHERKQVTNYSMKIGPNAFKVQDVVQRAKKYRTACFCIYCGGLSNSALWHSCCFMSSWTHSDLSFLTLKLNAFNWKVCMILFACKAIFEILRLEIYMYTANGRSNRSLLWRNKCMLAVTDGYWMNHLLSHLHAMLDI